MFKTIVWYKEETREGCLYFLELRVKQELIAAFSYLASKCMLLAISHHLFVLDEFSANSQIFSTALISTPVVLNGCEILGLLHCRTNTD